MDQRTKPVTDVPCRHDASKVIIDTGQVVAEKGPACPRCKSGNTHARQGLVERVQVPQFSIDFVYSGWLCSCCGTRVTPDEVQLQMNRIVEDRWVVLGVLPPLKSKEREPARTRK